MPAVLSGTDDSDGLRPTLLNPPGGDGDALRGDVDDGGAIETASPCVAIVASAKESHRRCLARIRRDRVMTAEKVPAARSDAVCTALTEGQMGATWNGSAQADVWKRPTVGKGRKAVADAKGKAATVLSLCSLLCPDDDVPTTIRNGGRPQR